MWTETRSSRPREAPRGRSLVNETYCKYRYSMFLSGRPLLDTQADAKFFVDRDSELNALLDSVASGLNAIVFGKRGSGKSSLLRRVAYQLQSARIHRVHMVDAGAAT